MQAGRAEYGTAQAHAQRASFSIECLLLQTRKLGMLLAALLACAAAHANHEGAALGGIHAEQAAAATRFGIAQTDNAIARLRSLHRGHDGCDRFDIGTNARWERAPAGGESVTAAAGGPTLADAFRHSRCDGRSALWAGGSLDLGFLRPSSTLDRSDFRTSGLTLGADMRATKGAIIGAAIGYGRHDTENDAASESRADAQQMILYGTFEPTAAVDIDAVVGVGELALDARPPATEFEPLPGERGGSQWFGSVALSADLAIPNGRVAPYARYDFVRSSLDAYRERGGAATAPAIGPFAAEGDTLALGIHADFTVALGSATLSPGLRVEQRRVSGGVLDQLSACAEQLPAAPGLRESDSDGSFAASLIVPVRFGSAALVAFEYSYTSASDAPRSESVRAHLQAPF